ncbi:MAG: Na+/H+ antiporter subunit E [Gammaproteobacteria bacterium]|nr:Na+/H+ antiporter subunit E [Gammaproteobacteria bacterium]
MQSGSSDNGKKYRASIIMFATLLLFWVLLAGSVDIETLAVGALAALLINLFYPAGFSFFTEFRATPEAFIAGLKYYRFFFAELIRSNLRLSAIVLSPELPVRPAIVKVRTRLKSRMGRLMLANSITLTPGTFTVELSGEWLYVHCVSAEAIDIDTASRQIVSQLESYLEVMYG